MLRFVARVLLILAIGVALPVWSNEALAQRGRHSSHGGGGHHAHVHHRVFVGVGPWWWGPPYPYWYYPPYYAYPPRVVIEEPPVYIEQQPPPSVPLTVEPTPQAREQFWYYCAPAGAYYPSVPTCAEPWIKVPPRSE